MPFVYDKEFAVFILMIVFKAIEWTEANLVILRKKPFFVTFTGKSEILYPFCKVLDGYIFVSIGYRKASKEFFCL